MVCFSLSHVFYHATDILPRASRHPLEPVNIGFAADPLKHNRHPSKRPELEPLARRRQLKISCDDVHKVDADLDAPRRRQQAAIHYGVFDDLFGEYHRFYPAQDVPIFFSQKNSETVSPIYCGNVISADIALVRNLFWFSKLICWCFNAYCVSCNVGQCEINVPNLFFCVVHL